MADGLEFDVTGVLGQRRGRRRVLPVVVAVEHVQFHAQPALGEAVLAHFRYDEVSGQRDEHDQRPEGKVLLPAFEHGEVNQRRKAQQLLTA